MKKKILFVLASLYNGGAERSMINLLNEMDYAKYDVDLLLFKKKGLFLEQIPKSVKLLETPADLRTLYSEKIKFNVKFIGKVLGTAAAYIRYKSFDYRRGFRWKYFYRHMTCCLDKNYDIAFAGISGDVAYYVMDKVKADKKIIMVHNHYIEAHYAREFDYPYFARADHIGTISEKCVDALKETFPDLSEKIVLLKNIVSPNAIRQRAREYIPDDMEKGKVKLLSIGRLSPEKGFDLAIQAAAILKENEIDFHWYIIGDGAEKNALLCQIKKAGVGDRVSLLGVRENPYVYIQNCDYVLQPSRVEGKSVVLDETKIIGKPIIATAYATVSDQLADGKEGIIVALSADGLAKGITYAIEHKEKMDEIQRYLLSHEYGNQEEIKNYYRVFEN